MNHTKSRRPKLLRALALTLAATLATSSLSLVGFGASAANAAAQNGYVFNDPWALQQPGSQSTANTQPSFRDTATNRATSTLPTRFGGVQLEAEFVPNGDRTRGTSFLTNGTDQSGYRGQARNFIGSPNPADVPALGLLTNSSAGCGGALNSAGHQNADAECPVGQLTIRFSEPMTDMVLDVSGIGGFAQSFENGGASRARGSFNSTIWDIASGNATFAQPSDGRTNLQVSDTRFRVQDRNTSVFCNDSGQQTRNDSRQNGPRYGSAGCGSVVLQGTYTEVTFNISSLASPFSMFPTAQYGTGSRYFYNDGSQYADGKNGHNTTYGETVLIPNGSTQSANSDLQRISFRLPSTGEIGDRVFNDANGDGLQSDGEEGVAGVTATLTDADGNPILDADGNEITTTTDANGNYRFTELPFGDYRVLFSDLPAGFSFTQANAGDDAADSDVDPATGLSDVVRINSANPVNETVDAGLIQGGSIGDRVWRDDNGDGVQDDGEPGLEGVTVVLYDADGNEVARTVTDADGAYLFEGLPFGDYQLEFVDTPNGWPLSPQGAGSDTDADSDADPATGRTRTVTISSQNRDRRDIDAGVTPRGSIGDRVWQDTNRDGVQDDGEPGLEGVTVVLYDADGNEVARTVTDADGAYRFTDLPLGDYSVGFEDLPEGSTFSPQGAGDDTAADSDVDPATARTATVSLTADAPNRDDIDAGILAPVGSIGDRVWQDDNRDGVQNDGERGVEGVTVVLYDADGNEVTRTVTDENGNYLFSDLPLGDYSVGFEDLPTGTSLSPQGAGSDTAADSDADPNTGRTDPITLTVADANRTDIDAGILPPLGSIGDRVWQDNNGDGVQDDGEPGVEGVTVVLYDADGNEVARTVTDADGAYVFRDLPLGEYSVGFESPDGFVFSPTGAGDADTDSDADPETGRTAPVTLTAENKDVTNVDAGLVPLGSIGDRVWQDNNGDGVQDDGEPGVEGVTVVLYDADGNEVARTVTDASGNYLFEDLPVGSYSVGIAEVPEGFAVSPQGAGDDAEADSDVDPATLRSGAVEITAENLNRRDVDAGLTPLGSIGDRVWQDDNRDGVQDDGEPGVEGVTVVLYDADGNEVARTVTDADGAYSFTDLPLGDYSVGFEDLPTGTSLSPQGAGNDPEADSDADPESGRTAPVTLTADERNRTDIDAGVLPPLGSIGDRVWQDNNGDGVQDDGEPGVEGVTVVLYDADGNEVARTVTDADGAYVFRDLPLGEYSVGFESPDGFVFSPTGAGDADTDSDADPETGRTAPVTLTAENKDVTNVDAGLVPLGSIGDRVWQDNNGDGVQDDGEPGVEGVTVVLYDADGNEVARTVTDASGNYLFEDLPVGSYSVGIAEVPEGFAVSPQGAGDDAEADSDVDPATLRSGAVEITAENLNRRDVDAGLTPLGSIGDRVWQDDNRDGVQDDGEPGIEGVTVVLYDADGNEVARTVTDADGAYSFTDLPLGDYSVGFEDLPTGTSLSPQGAGSDREADSDADPESGRTAPVTLTADERNRTDIDAGVLPPLGSIGDRVWQDNNGDGVQDDGEPGVEGVTVVLYDADGNEVARTVTDADGAYVFRDLPLGEYSVGFESPDGFVFSPTGAGDADTDSDADPETGRTAPVTLTAENKDVTNVDAGLVPLGSIGDRVWKDNNGDGVQDDGEPGVEGVTVVLYDADGNEVARTVTDANGNYLFEDLPVGSYSVGIAEVPGGFAVSPQGAGDDTEADSDVDPATLRSGAVEITAENLNRRDVDAGLTPLGSIGDRVWSDSNGDGVQDDGEPGLEGVTVVLYDADGNEVARTVTDADGAYSFTDLPLGDYSVGFEDLPEGTAFSPRGAGDDPDSDSDVDPATGRTGTVSLTPETPNVTNVDAGVQPVGTVGDRVWRDLNGDGVQDDGEPGVEGVTVILYDQDGNEVARTVTDADGAYSFTDVPLGTYSVGFEDLPEGQAFSPQGAGDDDSVNSKVDPKTGRTAPFEITEENREVSNIDAGVVQLGSIGDRVWKDNNGDGVQDDGEPGVEGVTVVLFDADGNEVARTVTDENGAYRFADLPLGDYSVGFEDLPEGTAFSPAGAGDDPASDSDADPATGRTGTVTLTNDNPNVDSVDAGLVPLGSIGDRVWKDNNGDGVQDDGEPGVEGVTVVLYDADGNEVARTVTDANGNYLFEDLPVGSYSVGIAEVPGGFAVSPQGAGDDTEADSDVDPATLRSGAVEITAENLNRRDVDAGLTPLGSIGDRVWSDSNGDGVQDDGEPGLEGVTVVLYDADGNEVARTVTDADGAYSFTDLPLGDYSVGFEDLPEGTAFSPRGAGDDPDSDSDVDPATGRTGTVSLTPETPNVTNVDAGVQPVGTVGDRVWRDTNSDGVQDGDEPGVEGVTVVLYDEEGNEVARTVTDSNGAYSFTDVPLGTYSVGFEGLPEGQGFSPQGAGDDDSVNSKADPKTGRTAPFQITEENREVSNIDAGVVQLGSIGDRVWNDRNGDGVQDEGEPGVEGVTVVLYDADGNEVARTVTDENGAYSFTDLPMGDYSVGFEGLPEGTAFSPAGAGDDPESDSDVDPATGRTGTVSLTNETPNVTSVDAGIQPVGSIGDRVWRDLNDNGVQDDGEAGVEGVTVVLYDADGNEVDRTVTDENGNYLFTGLPLGDYSVGFEGLPEGTGFSPQGAGDDTEADSDVDPATGRTGVVTLTEAARDVRSVDAGLVQLGSIGDRVWDDQNGDGVQDEGEPGLEGVTVVLYDADGNEVARTVTDANGAYSFTDLPMGDYSVGFEDLPEGTAFSPRGSGDDPDSDSDVDPATGRTGKVSLTNENPNVTNVDAGLQPVGTVGDRVWRDLNGDGVQDGDEPGISGVTVVLYDKDGNEVKRTVTDENGNYSFTDVPLGTYTVGFENLPESTGFSPQNTGDDPAANSKVDPKTGRTAPFDITNENRTVNNIDAGVQPLGSIGDRVWNDRNRDGVQDEGEPGLEGVTVVLYDADGNEVARTVTDKAGSYRFTDLPLGDYSVGFENLPEGAKFSPSGAGNDPERNSKVDPETGRTSVISLTNDAPNAKNVDAGVVLPIGSISSTVWEDSNNNGVRDPGERGVPGVTVILYDPSGKEIQRTKTDAKGNYRFNDVPYGDYELEFTDIPRGYEFTVTGGDSDVNPANGRVKVSVTGETPDVVGKSDAGIKKIAAPTPTPTPSDPGKPGDPGEPGTPGKPGGPGLPPTGADGGLLAPVALIALALMVAGGLLTRRRFGQQQ